MMSYNWTGHRPSTREVWILLSRQRRTLENLDLINLTLQRLVGYRRKGCLEVKEPVRTCYKGAGTREDRHKSQGLDP